MKTLEKLTAFGASLLLAASIGSAYAEEGDLTQTRDQDRVREEINLQDPASDSGQARYREEKRTMNKEQDGNQNRYRYQHQNGQGGPGASSMNRSTVSRSTSGGRN